MPKFAVAMKMQNMLGSVSYRRHSAVGPGAAWKGVRNFQIRFLLDSGLSPNHTLLDVGSGTLRGGIPIIAFLNRGNYWGVDVRSSVFPAARKELRKHRLVDKSPNLIECPGFVDLDLGRKFDFIWGFSVIIHMTDEILEESLAFVARHLEDKAVFYANVNCSNREDGLWQGFPSVRRSFSFYEEVATAVGLRTEHIGKLVEDKDYNIRIETSLPPNGHEMLRFRIPD